MHPEVVRKAFVARPFRPFVLHLAGGRAFAVPSPECIRVPDTNNRLVIVYPPSGSSHVVDLFYVTDVEFPHTILT